MPRMLPAALMACAVVATASAAQATTFLTVAPAGADGSVSAVFGNDGVDTPTFSDAFDFVFPGVGKTSITFATVGVGATNLDFISATLNGTPITLSPTGLFEFGLLSDLATTGGPQHLVISGNSGGPGSYAGSVSFTPTVVPEPAAWGLMITGFGGMGAMIRTRKAKAAMG